MITYLIDRLRIELGDSVCPLYHRCPSSDKESGCCVSYRGRTEIRGDRAMCYENFKPLIKAQKQNLISRLAEKVTQSLLHLGGLKD